MDLLAATLIMVGWQSKQDGWSLLQDLVKLSHKWSYIVKLGHLEAGRPHHIRWKHHGMIRMNWACYKYNQIRRQKRGHLDSPSSTSSVLTFNIYIIRFITVTVNNITSINSTNKISYQQHLDHDQVRKDERMGLAKAPPGDGDPTHLRFAELLFFWKSVYCFWHTVQNHCFQDPKVETRGRRFVHNSTLQSHVSLSDLLKKTSQELRMLSRSLSDCKSQPEYIYI